MRKKKISFIFITHLYRKSKFDRARIDILNLNEQLKTGHINLKDISKEKICFFVTHSELKSKEYFSLISTRLQFLFDL